MVLTLRQVDGHKLAKIMAVIMVIFSLFFLPIFFWSNFLFSNDLGLSFISTIIIIIVVPVFYYGITYLFTRFGCWVFNTALLRMDGLDLKIEERYVGMKDC
ncbi:MAG: hypothetical protein MI717_14595 [Spirochaetales bacterium]|nr:hypothetical protein [Spirochaetales bacterium]